METEPAMRFSSFRRRALHSLLTPAAVALACLSVGATGCKRPSAQSIVLTKDQEQQIAESVLNAPPANLQHKAEVKFDDKITLLGYDLKGTPARKGGTFDLTMYFRVDQPVTGDWKVFVHFEAPGKRRQPFDHYGVGGLYPVGMWKKGEIVRDTVSIQVPADWPDGQAHVLIGFFDSGAWDKAQQTRRLKPTASAPIQVEADERVLLTTVDVGGAAPGGEAMARPPRAAPTPPAPGAEYTVGMTATPPTIDGKADDAIWQTATQTVAFRHPDGVALTTGIGTSVKLAWDKDNLYVAASTRDEDIRTEHKQNDSTLWEGDVIEFFVQVPGKTGEYVELQWNPAGARFDARFTGHREPKWEEAAKFESGVRHAVSLDGTLNDATADKGWSIEAAIPWKGMGLDTAPSAGTRIAANLYRIDDKGTHDIRHMATWSPVGNDFHQLQGAGTLILGETTAAVLPAPVPALPPTAAPAAPAAAPAPAPAPALVPAGAK